jgi:hypothetical protein
MKNVSIDFKADVVNLVFLILSMLTRKTNDPANPVCNPAEGERILFE